MKGTVLRHVVLLVRDVPTCVRFYEEGLGLGVIRQSHRWAELGQIGTNVSPCLALKAVDNESHCHTGYSPIFSFSVMHSNFDNIISRLLQLGASLDGPIRRQASGATVVMRSPDGHMVGISSISTDERHTHAASAERL